MRKHIAPVIASVAMLIFGNVAQAEVTPGFYAGLSLGEGSLEVEDLGFDESDTSFKVFGGYTFNDFFALELAWIDGGNPELDAGNGDALEGELSGISATAVGNLPLGEVFTLFGKIGLVSFDAELTLRLDGVPVVSTEDSDEEIIYGVGGAFSFGQSFSLRAEYEFIDASGGEFNMLSLGGVFRF